MVMRKMANPSAPITYIDISAVIRFVGHFLLFLGDLELESEFVDCDGVLPGVILLHTGGERLREIESGQPERGGCAVFNPIREKLQPKTNQIRQYSFRLHYCQYLFHSSYCICLNGYFYKSSVFDTVVWNHIGWRTKR